MTEKWISKFYKSVMAAVFIALGVAANLNLGYPLGPFLFAFGLMVVCISDRYLYTGVVGYWWRDRPYAPAMTSRRKDILFVLFINCLTGYLTGILLGVGNPTIVMEAIAKVNTWELTIPFFIKAVFCGAIMYFCVAAWKKVRTLYGIIFGVPLFLFCGFQHSIANAITLGVAAPGLGHITGENVLCIILAVIGNAVGAILSDYFMENKYVE